MWTPIRLLQFFQLSRHFSVLFYAFFLPFLGFSKAEIGSFELLQILAFSFSFFWVSGLIQGLMIVYPSLPDKQKRNMLYNAFLFFIFISFFSLTILLICIYLKFPGFQYFSQISFLWIFLIYYLVNTPGQLVEYVLFLEDKYKWLKIFCLISFPLQIVFFSVPLLLFNDLFWGIAGLLLWSVVRCVFLIFHYHSGYFLLDKKILFKWIGYSIPLLFSALVGGLASVINAALVQYNFSGNADVFAIYRYGARELPFVNGLFEGLGIGIISSLVTNLQNGLIKLKNNTRTLIHLIFPISIFLMLFVNIWFPLLFSSQFQESIPIIKIFLFLVILRIIPTNAVINALGNSKILAIIGLLELIVHICCSIIGLKWFGLIGIAYATCAAYFFEKLVGLVFLKWANKISMHHLLPFGWWLFYSILLIGSYFINF